MSHRNATTTERVEALLNRIGRRVGSLSALLPRLAHRRRLASVDTKTVVSGTRGKSSLARWLYEILHDRGHDAYAKVTGNRPHSLYDGERRDIERGNRVTLYENARELRKYTPDDQMILENQAVTSHTTRAVNRFFARADVVVLSNIREDHLSTLGTDRNLHEHDERAFGTVHVGGGMADLFEREAEFPVEAHDTDRESAGSVLDSLLGDGRPALLTGNTVAEFVREMEAEIERRADGVGGDESARDAPSDDPSDSPDRREERPPEDRRRAVVGEASGDD